MSADSPSPEELQRELEQVRAASPVLQVSPEGPPPAKKRPIKPWLLTLIVWAVIVLLFIGFYMYFSAQG